MSTPPSARIVTPEAPVNDVKNAHTRAVTDRRPRRGIARPAHWKPRARAVWMPLPLEVAGQLKDGNAGEHVVGVRL